MSYFFSSDGSLKYSTKTQASVLKSAKRSSSGSSDASAAESSASSSSSFSKEMKSAALAASGKITSSMKDEARASNKDYQRMAVYQKRIQEIAARKPRTFSDDESFTFNTKVMSNYATAQEKYQSSKKTSTRPAT